jgi:hypothetical protein
MATNILMQKGCVFHDVAPEDVERWKGFGYEVASTQNLQSNSRKEVAEEAPASSVPPVTQTTKRTATTRKKGVPKDDKP